MFKSTKLIPLVSTLALTAAWCIPSYALTDLPEAAVKAPLLVQEKTISTYVPSDTAPGKGLAVNIILPQKARYAAGAPVVVVVPGAEDADGLSFSAHTAQCGFVEVRFAFPGGGVKGFSSSGTYDYRGPLCQEALRDILMFVGGKGTDSEGRHIADLVPVKVSATDIGIMGWANGANVALITLAKYPEKLRFVSWLALYEPPVGPMFFPPNLGGEHDLVINKHYRPGSCATGDCLVDYRKLAFHPNAVRLVDQRKKRGEPIIPGLIFFDENKDGNWQEEKEFAFSYALDVGLDKQIYPPDVTAAMQRFSIFRMWEVDDGPFAKKKDKKGKVIPDSDADLLSPKQTKAREKMRTANTKLWVKEMEAKLAATPSAEVKVENGVVMRLKFKWPATIATLTESEAYYGDRDGSQYVDQVCANYPWLLVTIFGSQIDQTQRQIDHPNIVFLYNAFLSDKAHWVRLNPDPQYVAFAATMNQGNFKDNKPNNPIDASDILDQLEPEGLIPDYVYMGATVSELADRARSKDPTAALASVLVKYQYGAGPMPKLEEQ